MSHPTKVQTPPKEASPYVLKGSALSAPPKLANDHHPTATLTLTLSGQTIRDRGEMLSLTDMWKAAGSDPSKRPVEWARKEGASFIEHMKDVLEVPHSHFQTSRGGRGIGGSTFAHWQIALAYAKYLSNEFHAACNVVIREQMEGRHTPVAALPGNLVDEIHRILGINKMLSHKVTVIEQGMTQMREQYVSAIVALDPRVAALAYISANEILDKEWKVPSRGRRSIQRKVLNRLLAYCATGAMRGTKAAYSGTWIFPRVEAIDFVKSTCGLLIRDHLDKVGRQGVLKLVKP